MATETLQDQAERIRAEYNRLRTSVIADTTRSQDWKTAQIQDAVESTNRQIDELFAKYQAEREDRRRELTRKLLGPPAAPTSATVSDRLTLEASYRDAMDRARNAAEHDRGETRLRNLFDSADRTADDTQARAAMAVAFDNRWTEIVDAYLAKHPEYADAAQELWALEGISSGGSFLSAMAFAHVAP